MIIQRRSKSTAAPIPDADKAPDYKLDLDRERRIEAFIAKAPDYKPEGGPELTEELLDRLYAALAPGETRTDFIRQAVERELARREPVEGT